MTARLTTCNDLAKNEGDLKMIGELFLALQTSATPLSLLISWFPSLARKLGKVATTELFTVLHAYVEARRRGEPTDDPIDFLIAEGEATQAIVEVILPSPRVAWDVGSDPFIPVCDDNAFRGDQQHRHCL